MIQFNGGDGSSKEEAIIIHGVYTEWGGVDAEYRYLDFHYKGWQLDEQTLILNKDMQYDLMVIILLDGSKKDVWFDITEFCC
jgi:hypothetical protein